MISEKAGMRILAKIRRCQCRRRHQHNAGVLVQKNRPHAGCAFCAAIWKAIQYLKSHKDESLKIFSKYVRNPDLAIMAYLYEEISTRAKKKELRPQTEAVRAMIDLAASRLPASKEVDGER